MTRAASGPRHQENLERFAEFVSVWNEPVSRAILEVFELPEDILDAFEYENPYGGSWPPANLGDLIFVASLAAETPNPFDSVLGVRSRPELFDSCVAGIDKDKLDELLSAARTGKQEMLSAVCN